jgi:hypothetical protein
VQLGIGDMRLLADDRNRIRNRRPALGRREIGHGKGLRFTVNSER